MTQYYDVLTQTATQTYFVSKMCSYMKHYYCQIGRDRGSGTRFWNEDSTSSCRGWMCFFFRLFVLPSYHSITKFMANFLKKRKTGQKHNEHVMSSYTYVLEVKSWILRVYISFLEYDHTYILKGWTSQKPIYPCCCCEGDDHRCHMIIFMGWRSQVVKVESGQDSNYKTHPSQYYSEHL